MPIVVSFNSGTLSKALLNLSTSKGSAPPTVRSLSERPELFGRRNNLAAYDRLHMIQIGYTGRQYLSGQQSCRFRLGYPHFAQRESNQSVNKAVQGQNL